MNRLLAIFTGRHQPDREALSAYLDGELAPERSAAIEAHVTSCEACASTLEGMRGVRAMLRALPETDAPRSFRLRPADVEAPRQAVPAPPTTLMRAMPVLSGAAVLVFAIAVSFDVARSGSGGDGGADLAAMADGAAETNQYDASRGNDGPSIVAPAPGGESNGTPDATPPAPAASAAPPDAADATSTAAIEARAGSDGGAAPQDEAARDTEATVAIRDTGGDGNNLALRIVQITSAAVAIAAAVIGIRLWRSRGRAPA